MERRIHPRMEIRRRCELEVVGSGEILQGKTLNLSRTGALIELNFLRGCLEPGENVIVRIELPPRARFEHKCMECPSVVCRFEATSDTSAVVALHIRSAQFQSADRMVASTPTIEYPNRTEFRARQE